MEEAEEGMVGVLRAMRAGRRGRRRKEGNVESVVGVGLVPIANCDGVTAS